MVRLGRRELLGQAETDADEEATIRFTPACWAASTTLNVPSTEHVEREARILGAVRDADRGQVEDEVDALHHVPETGASRGCRPRRS